MTRKRKLNTPTTETPLFGRIQIYRNLRFPLKPDHGPQTWPWWRILSIRFNRLSICPPSTGFVMWLYTRWGAGYIDVVFDRRSLIE